MSIYKLITVVVGLYVAWCLLLFFAQRFVLFPAGMAGGTEAARPPAGFVVVHFETPTDTVEGWYLPPPRSTAERPGPDWSVFWQDLGEFLQAAGVTGGDMEFQVSIANGPPPGQLSSV